MICMQLGIKLFYLFMYERADFLFVILFTVVRVIELSVDPSSIFFLIFVISSSSLLFSAGCTLCFAYFFYLMLFDICLVLWLSSRGAMCAGLGKIDCNRYRFSLLFVHRMR